jgi:hemolysin D
MLWSLLLLLGCTLAWASWARIDIVARAPGKVIPGDRIKVVQPFERGTVTAIHVDEGDLVERGALLIELDASQARARLERILEEVATLHDRSRRLVHLHRFMEGEAPSVGPPTQELAPGQQALLARQKAEISARLDQLDGERVQLESEREAVAARIDGLHDILELVTQRSSALRKLSTVGHAATQAWLEVEQERRELETALAESRAKTRVLDARLLTLERVRISYLSERLRGVADEQVEVRLRLGVLEQEAAAARTDVRRHRLHAPVSGRIQQLAVHTLGAVVTPAQELLKLVPESGGLEVEARVMNRDSGEVRPGMPAVVKVDAYPFTRHGMLAAKVLSLSADAVADRALGLVYSARIELSDLAAFTAGGPHLEPGMAVSVEVMTGRRRVIELLLTPLVRALKEAGQER